MKSQLIYSFVLFSLSTPDFFLMPIDVAISLLWSRVLQRATV